ncbi:MAG: hypothetical protein CL843_10645 [Crocinitomicaceae bacterium]|nr:hypothetical protein [Crocinitomicaceae bacterium]|tara:strand:+ start:3092 stop:4024 length:933 start_codon:yes stop_codon:yes gene_type:complete
MSLFEEEKQDSTDVIQFLYSNRKALIISFVIGGVLACAVSFLLPKKYRSTGIIYPPNTYVRDQLISNPQFGHEIEVEHLLQLLESASLRDSVIDQFNLIDYYEIDTTSTAGWKQELVLKYIDDVKFFRSKYLSVVINVETKDAVLSANIVNYIIETVNKHKKAVFQGNIKNEIEYFKKRYEESKKKPQEILDQIYALKDTSTSKNLISNYLNNLNKENFVNNDFIDSREMESLVEEYIIYDDQMKERKHDYEQALDANSKPLLKNYVIDYAKPNYKKVSPSISVNALIGSAIALLATLIVLAWKRKVKAL